MTDRRIDAYPLSRLLIISAAIVFIIWGINQAEWVLVFVPRIPFLRCSCNPAGALARTKTRSQLRGRLGDRRRHGRGSVGGWGGRRHVHQQFLRHPAQYQAHIQEEVAAFKVFLATKNIALPDKLLLEYVNPGAVMNMTAGLFMRLGYGLFQHPADRAHRDIYPARSRELPDEAPRRPWRSDAGISSVHKVCG